MEARNNRMDLVIGDLNLSAITSKKRKYTAKQKKRILNVIKLGRKVPVRDDYNKDYSGFCFYHDNSFVYTDYEDIKKVTRYIVNKDRPEHEDSITTERIDFSNEVHVRQRMAGRNITFTEIAICLNHGRFVPDYTKNKQTGWVNYDRYYFFDDLCVVAVRRKDHWIVSTTYRISPINDAGFLDNIEKIIEDIPGATDSVAALYSRTAIRKFHNTKEHMDWLIVRQLEKEKTPFESGLPLLKDRIKYWGLWNMVQCDQRKFDLYKSTIESQAFMKMAELGMIRYSTKDHDGISIKDFCPIRSHEYHMNIEFSIGDREEMTFNQRIYLKNIGIDLNKIEHQITKKKDGKNNIINLDFSMNNFCANENTWSIRREHGA